MWIAIECRSRLSNWQESLLEIACAITPSLVWHDREILLLDVTSSLQWLGGAHALKRRLRKEFSQQQINTQVAMAPSAMGAWLLVIGTSTSESWRYALSLRRLSSWLNDLDVALLQAAQPFLTWLHRLGCRRLGQLQSLNRQELAQRTNKSLIDALDLAYGKRPFIYKPLKLPPRFSARWELPYLIEQCSDLEPYLKRSIQQLCQWLSQNQLAISSLECRLHHRDRLRARPPTVLNLSIAQSTGKFSVLWRWLQTRLEVTRLIACVSDLEFLSRSLEPSRKENHLLFSDHNEDVQSLAQTLDLLRARLGCSSVQQPKPLADYRPERANQWVASSPASPTSTPLPLGAHCPAWLLHSPRPLACVQDRPALNGPLRILHGPYRVEAGWWDHQFVMRDYFVATDTSSRRYWIYRERGQIQSQWFLHGLFG